MTVTLSKIQKKGLLLPGEVVSQYLNVLPNTLDKKKREGFIFVKKFGSVGFVFEGNVAKRDESDVVSYTTKIGGKDFAIVVYALENNDDAIRKLGARVLKEFSKPSSFVLMEHTGRWGVYNNKSWLRGNAPPRLTPGGNIYLPQGAISAYFGDEDARETYKDEKRGVEFASKNAPEDYPTIVNKYYGQFLDKENLAGLATKKETGLNHFTMGVYESRGRPVIFHIKNKANTGKQMLVKTENTQVTCSNGLVMYALKNIMYKEQATLFPPGKVLEHAI